MRTCRSSHVGKRQLEKHLQAESSPSASPSPAAAATPAAPPPSQSAPYVETCPANAQAVLVAHCRPSADAWDCSSSPAAAPPSAGSSTKDDLASLFDPTFQSTSPSASAAPSAEASDPESTHAGTNGSARKRTAHCIARCTLYLMGRSVARRVQEREAAERAAEAERAMVADEVEAKVRRGALGRLRWPQR